MKKIILSLILVFLLLNIALINSCKKETSIPTLTTTTQKNVTINSATSGGVISKDGGEAVTARGVCWGIANNPTANGSHTSDGTGTGSFESTITGLNPNTLYYVRAYATNSVGTAYGNEISFTSSPVVVATLTTTAVTSITLISAVSGGNISANGGGDITAKGTCWSTTESPTISDSKTIDGTGTGSFVSNLSGLLPGTTYFIRAYATNSAGTAYGNEVSFSTSQVVVPTLTTTTATSITLTSAVSGGNITADGGGAVTARGICWATTTNPNIIDNSKTINGTGTGSFTSNLSELLPATLYYVRAYATNSAGTAYGDEVSFTTTPVGVASLTTTVVTSISLTTAVSGGNIIADGGGTVTARGICWSTTTNPTTASSKTTDGTGIGSFTSDLTGLLPATVYYVRAYATNSAGTAYGNEVSFTTSQIVVATLTTTAITAIGLNTAVSGGNISANGGGTITASGVCWATTTAPTISNYITTDAPGTGIFTSNLSGLLPGTTYYVRAYATNSAGTAYGNEQLFTTLQIVVPTLTTTAATTIALTTAVSGGNITADGGAAITARGTCWATTANPTITSSKTDDGTGTGIFTSNLSSLLPATTYHIRAYATNSAGTAYGNDLTFTTNSVGIATLTTTTVTTITLTTAVSGGNITSNGGGAITAKGVCWATTATPTITNSKTTDGTGSGNFVSNMTLLLPGTTYFARAYATNSAGTAYGNEVSFTTNATLPTLTTAAVTGVTINSAISGGNITSNGGGAITAKGVCWSTSTFPTIANYSSTDGTGSSSFVSNLTSLLPGTTYYVRAYATNSAGTAYGNQFSLNTRIADVDGTDYGTVTIGTQVWMTENLRTTRFNNNTVIDNITGNSAWIILLTPAYCWYNNDATTYKATYGALYNWFAVNAGNLCPTGWHVPSDVEFQTLETYLGMPSAQLSLWGWRGTDQGAQMKNTTGWAAGQNGTNTSGLSALPAGYRYGVTGVFNDAGNLFYWWSSTEGDATTSLYRRLDGVNSDVFRGGVLKQGGKNVRCMKD